MQTMQNNNRVWISAQRTAFKNENFDHKNESIQAFYARLLNFKATLSGTLRPLQSEDILEKILESVPLKDPNWAQARLHCLNMDLSLPDAIIVLANVVSPSAEVQVNFAKTKGSGNNRRRNNRGNRARNNDSRQKPYHNHRGGLNSPNFRGGRFQRRGGCMGRNFNPNHHKMSREDGHNNGSKICKFCQAKGHEEEEVRANKDACNSSANLAKEYNGTAYFPAPLSDKNSVISYIATETALLSTNLLTFWKVDSGASQHFSGIMSDFDSFTKWKHEKLVSTADGNLVKSTGYGNCKIGNFILKNVWLVPKFSVRLISVCQLGNIDIDVLFKGSRAIATKGGSVVFTANLVEGLFQVSSQSNQAEDSAKMALERSNSQTSSLHNTSGIQHPTNTSHLEHHSSSHAPSSEFASKPHLWHYRLGHAGYKAIERLGRDGIIRVEKKPVNKGYEACVPCLAGKMKESFNKKTHNRTHIPARRLHADISGILPESY
ncbi:hypothetical protein K3495_g10638, partial [Podosphaera aphanis]